jgi:hypothetical protein
MPQHFQTMAQLLEQLLHNSSEVYNVLTVWAAN